MGQNTQKLQFLDLLGQNTGCFFYVLSYSARPHAVILGPILLIDQSISSHYYALSNEVSIIILLLLGAELQANT